MDAEKIIKAAIPNANASIIDYVLWERTPFPVGAVTARDLYKAASSCSRAFKNGVKQCELCPNGRAPDDDSCCPRCRRTLNRISQEQP